MTRTIVSERKVCAKCGHEPHEGPCKQFIERVVDSSPSTRKDRCDCEENSAGGKP